MSIPRVGGIGAAGPSRRSVLGLVGLCPALAVADTRKPAPSQKTAPSKAPSLSAARSIMAGAPLSVFLRDTPPGARLALARPEDPADRAIVVLAIRTSVPSLPTPGLAGQYELRLMLDREGQPTVLLRQPLVTSEPGATLAAPDRVGRGRSVPVRGIGPNGERDSVVLVEAEAPADAQGPRFFPAENVEAVLDAPDKPGRYELRYVLDAPVSGLRILARRPLIVD